MEAQVSRKYPNPIVLDKALPKCLPHHRVCDLAGLCASALVDGGGRGRRDYTAGVNWWQSDYCPGWRDAASHRPDPAKPAPTVHEAPKGLK